MTTDGASAKLAAALAECGLPVQVLAQALAEVHYYQQNNTLTAIDEATLRLYFKNDVPVAQFGFFGRLLPGAAYGVIRSYTFDALQIAQPWLLQYDADHFFAAQPVAGALQWLFPIR